MNLGRLLGGAVGTFAADALFGTLPGNDAHADGGAVSLGDLDDDGDLDLYLANSGRLFVPDHQDRLLINDY